MNRSAHSTRSPACRCRTTCSQTWQQEQRTVVFITHDVDEAVYLASRVVVMSPRPGRISEIIDVPLPYPRREELRLSPEFARDPRHECGAVCTTPECQPTRPHHH